MSTSSLLDRIAILEKENSHLRQQLCEPESTRLLKSLALHRLETVINQSLEQLPPTVSGEMQTAMTAVVELTDRYQTLDASFQSCTNDVLLPLREANETLSARCQELELENLLQKDEEAAEEKTLENMVATLKESETNLIETLGSVKLAQQTLSTSHEESLNALRASTQGVEKLATENAAVASQLVELQADQEAARTTITLSLERQIEELKLELGNRDATIAALQASMQQTLHENVSMRETITNSEAARSELFAQLTAQKKQTEDVEVTLEQRKRRRLEMDRIEEKSSRGELISFWYEGHETILELQEEVGKIAPLRLQLEQMNEQAATLAANRSASVEAITTLTREVDRLQKDAVSLRQQNMGLEAEVESLITHLSKLIGKEMSPQEVRQCAETFRKAAVRAAEANALSVVDKNAVEAALRRARELRQEISQLSKQREKLLRVVHLREQRLQAINSSCKLLVAKELSLSNNGTTKTREMLFSEDSAIMRKLLTRIDQLLEMDVEDPHLREAVKHRFQVDAHDAEESALRIELAVLRQENQSLSAALEQSRTDLQNAADVHLQTQQENMQQVKSILSSIANVQNETMQLRVHAAASNHLLQRACEIAIASMQFSVSQVARLQQLFAEKEDSRKQIAALKKQLQQANRATESRMDAVEKQLTEQLLFLKETAGEEQRRHTLREVKYVMAYAEDVKMQVRALQDARAEYLRGTKQQATALSTLLTEVKGQWLQANQQTLAAKAAVENPASTMVAEAVQSAVAKQYRELLDSAQAKGKSLLGGGTGVGVDGVVTTSLEVLKAELGAIVDKF